MHGCRLKSWTFSSFKYFSNMLCAVKLRVLGLMAYTGIQALPSTRYPIIVNRLQEHETVLHTLCNPSLILTSSTYVCHRFHRYYLDTNTDMQTLTTQLFAQPPRCRLLFSWLPIGGMLLFSIKFYFLGQFMLLFV